MHKQGTVVRWNTERGFGFIRSPGTPADVFFHVRDFRGAETPSEGLAVAYEEIHVGGKGPRAMAVKPLQAPARPPGARSGAPAASRRGPKDLDRSAGPARRRSAPPRSTPSHRDAPAAPLLLLMGVWLALIGWGIWTARLPLPTLIAVPLLNLATFFVYWTDKYAAQQGHWRTRESTLHLLGLLGGWPGAWAAHQVLRHKSRKAEFRAVYWATVVLHCAALGGWLFWVQPGLR